MDHAGDTFENFGSKDGFHLTRFLNLKILILGVKFDILSDSKRNHLPESSESPFY